MKDIPMKRIMRLYLAAFIVLFSVAWSNPANAETGTITISDDNITNFNGVPSVGSGAWYQNYSRIHFNNTIYNYLGSFHLHPYGATYTNEFESTTCTILTGATASSCVVWYDRNLSAVYYAFSSDMVATGPWINLTLTKDIFRNITYTTTNNYHAWDVIGTPKNTPICVGLNNTVINQCDPGQYHDIQVSAHASDTYDVSYPFPGIFRLNITKNAFVNSSYIIHGSSSTYSQETTFNKINITGAMFNFNDGLYLNVTLLSGYFNDVLINSTNSGIVPVVAPTVDPITGVGISFDASTYSIGGTANISWIRTTETPFGYQDDIYLIQPGNIKKILVSSPSDTGFVKTNDLPVAGSYNVTFERSVLGFFINVLDADTATVSAEQTSYILVNNTVPVGVYTSGIYLAGWTGVGRIVIYQDLPDGTIKEIDSLATTGICCNETTVSQLFFPEAGNYRVVLMKGFDTVKATASVIAYLSNIVPGANITISNISLNKAQYTYGEPYTIVYQVDSVNYSNKAKRIIAYEISTGANTLVNQVPAQTGTITRTFDSEMYPFSGALQLRLMGLNASGDFVLAYVNFTLSRIDTEGYGLDVTKSPICIKETGYFTYYSPSPATVSIADRDVTVYSKNLTTAISGKTVPFTISRAGNYEIFLRPNNSNDVKFTKIIEVKACNISAQAPVSGAGQAQQVATMITTPIFWALIVTAGLVIAIAWKTRDGFAAGSVGMLSAGVFTSVTWLPLWIFFSALIIAALLLSSSIVAKQLKKTG